MACQTIHLSQLVHCECMAAASAKPVKHLLQQTLKKMALCTSTVSRWRLKLQCSLNAAVLALLKQLVLFHWLGHCFGRWRGGWKVMPTDA